MQLILRVIYLFTVLLILPPTSFTTATVTQTPLKSSNTRSPLTFYLRHLHTITNTSRVVFADVPVSSAQSLNYVVDQYTLDTTRLTTYRPARPRCGSHSLEGSELVSAIQWDEEEIVGPDVTSRETLLQLAKMTNDAYVWPDESDWYDLGKDWNISYPFGWEEDADGFRGHVFATADNSTVVISIKGTSTAFLGGGGPTSKKDKLNNNLLFSCCCANVGFSWTPVCGCYGGGWKCDQNCLEDSLVEDSLFYPIGTNLYNNISYMYPNSNIWITGHSLGGSLASLVGVTFGAPVVAFEAPGEKMAARRLHLPSPPSTQHITHVYHTADSIPMGTCNGIFSGCAIAGYALESRCHLGKSIVYDTVTKLNWSVGVSSHRIKVIIDQLLAKDWNETVASLDYDDNLAVPIAKPEDDCIECYKWEYGDFLNKTN